jgi:hypothetical protein
MLLRLLSSLEGTVDSSMEPTMYSGLFNSSATDSAVRVLPVPGGPCKTATYFRYKRVLSLRCSLAWTYQAAAFAGDDIRDDPAGRVRVLGDFDECFDEQLQGANQLQ